MNVFARTFLVPLLLIVSSIWAQTDDYGWGIIAGLIYCVVSATVLDLIRIAQQDNK